MTDKNEKSIEVDFARFQERYSEELQNSISFIGQDADFFTEVKAAHLLNLAGKHLGSLKDIKALDVGCGVGLTDRFLASKLGSLHGVDIVEGVLEKAAVKNPSAHYQVYDGKELPFLENTFDLAFAICVMEYLTPHDQENFLREMHRVVRKGGVVVVFQHNSLNPLTRLVLNRCEYDSPGQQVPRGRIKKIFKKMGLSSIDDRFILFFPWRKKIFRQLELRMGWFPLGAQYCLAGKK